MYQCRYCGVVLPALPSDGCCQHCGGPNPKELKPRVVERVVHEYVFVGNAQTGTAYYRPSALRSPIQATRANLYGTFGYKWATALLLVFLAVVGTSFFYWLSYRAPRLVTTDPKYQLSLPTAAPTATAVADSNPWKEEAWLTAAEAKNLRIRENVVNMAYLEGGNAKYSATHSFPFAENDPWERAKSLGVTELTVTGTSVTIKAGGFSYTLNVLQPFILAFQSTKISIVGTTGELWQADAIDLVLMPIEDIVSGLPTVVAPNPNLSFTY